MIFTTEFGQRIATDDLLGKGGEGEVWAIQGDSSQVAKIYHSKNRQPEREAKIKAMVANPPKDETRNFDPPHVSIAWPTAPLYEQGNFVGYLMPRIENSPNIFQVYNTTARAKTSLTHFDWRYMHRVAQNFAIALHALHDKGDVMGDVNQQNVLVTDTAMVTLVDTDSFQIQDGSRTFRCTVGVPDYTPPELHGLKLEAIDRSVEHDRFGLAILIFQLLMKGFHPFTGAPKDPKFSVEGSMYVYCIKNGIFPYQNNPTIKPPAQAPNIACLHPDLQVLFGRTFIAGHRQPNLRPTTKDWIDGLKVAERDLVKCQKNPKHWYGDHLLSCPWCASPGTVPEQRQYTGLPTQQPMLGLPRQQDPQDVLSSEKGIDYTHLRNLLKSEKWRDADEETFEAMLHAVGLESGDCFTADKLLNFPSADLRTIDSLWVKYSQGKFGFSIQKKIYEKCGGKLDGKYPGNKVWHQFCDCVGWSQDGEYLNYLNLTANASSSPAGELPCGGGHVYWLGGLTWVVWVNSLLSHRDLETIKQTTDSRLKFVQDDLKSEQRISYTRLRDLLKDGKWRDADKETYEVMLQAVGRKSGEYIGSKELWNFPCTDLRTIDRLWVKYSQGKYGFSVQKKIYVECGAKLDGQYPGDKIWDEFRERVGWRDRNLKANPSFSPSGELPSAGQPFFFPIPVGGGSCLAQRLVTCNL